MNGWKYLASQNDSFTHGKVYTDVKWLSQHLYDLRFSRPYVLVRVGYLSSSVAYTEQLGSLLKGKLLGFRRRSEVTINLTRPLKNMQANEFLSLLYYIVFFGPCDLHSTCSKQFSSFIVFLNNKIMMCQYFIFNDTSNTLHM